MQRELELVRHQIAADWTSLRQELAETRAELDVIRREIAALLPLRMPRGARDQVTGKLRRR